jgi:hypothetical protein
MVRALDFNQEVCLDTLNLFDSEHKKIETLSILDMATGYHVVKKISGKKSANLLKDFMEGWVNWAGPHMRVGRLHFSHGELRQEQPEEEPRLLPCTMAVRC